MQAARRWQPAFSKGLCAIEGLPGLRRRIGVYLGAHPLAPEPGIEVLPLERFLELLARGLC